MNTEQFLYLPNSFTNSLRTVIEPTEQYEQFIVKLFYCKKLTKTHSLGNCFAFCSKLFRLFGLRFKSPFKTVRTVRNRGFGC